MLVTLTAADLRCLGLAAASIFSVALESHVFTATATDDLPESVLVIRLPDDLERLVAGIEDRLPVACSCWV
jgi:hypothetical protein